MNTNSCARLVATTPIRPEDVPGVFHPLGESKVFAGAFAHAQEAAQDESPKAATPRQRAYSDVTYPDPSRDRLPCNPLPIALVEDDTLSEIKLIRLTRP